MTRRDNVLVGVFRQWSGGVTEAEAHFAFLPLPDLPILISLFVFGIFILFAFLHLTFLCGV